MRRILFALVALAAVPGCSDSSEPPSTTPPPAAHYRYAVVDTLPHDPGAFTQGLLFHDGHFFESTGVYGRSSLREVDPETGSILRSVDLDHDFWGEGLALLGDRLYQLTWRAGECFLYDAATFERIDTFTYPTEGWGLTTDGTRLILSDGTATLYFMDPATFTETGRVTVHDGGQAINRLNELEYIDGEVWANVWQTDRIVRIDPADGRVTAWVDLSGLTPWGQCSNQLDVLNGIAWDPATKRLWVTGKYWCRLYEIRPVLEDAGDAGSPKR